MPMSYEIDDQQDELRFIGSGVLTEDEILDCVKVMRSDPNIRPGMPRLSDCRSVETFNITPDGFGRVIALMKSTAHPESPARNALVVSSKLGFGLGRMFSLMSHDETDVEFQVFYDLDAARNWLHGT